MALRCTISPALVLISLSGCQQKPSIEDSLRIQATEVITATLVDPQSAQFSDWQFFPVSKAVCGRVNAKNRMGGYAGRSFFAFKDRRLDLANGDTLSELKVQNRCARYRNDEYNIDHADERAARQARQAKRAAERASKERSERGGKGGQ